jgi:eukaryotic-like serine/threonine-protein kinase
VAGLAGQDDVRTSATEASSEADKAMALLKKDVSMVYRGSHTVRTESALDPLRSRDDFRLLMLDLAFPAQPLAQ